MKDPLYCCVKCGVDTIRSERFDAYYCKGCDVWTEPKCGDSLCEYCGNRPDKPSEANA